LEDQISGLSSQLSALQDTLKTLEVSQMEPLLEDEVTGGTNIPLSDETDEEDSNSRTRTVSPGVYNERSLHAPLTSGNVRNHNSLQTQGLDDRIEVLMQRMSSSEDGSQLPKPSVLVDDEGNLVCFREDTHAKPFNSPEPATNASSIHSSTSGNIDMTQSPWKSAVKDWLIDLSQRTPDNKLDTAMLLAQLEGTSTPPRKSQSVQESVDGTTIVEDGNDGITPVYIKKGDSSSETSSEDFRAQKKVNFDGQLDPIIEGHWEKNEANGDGKFELHDYSGPELASMLERATTVHLFEDESKDISDGKRTPEVSSSGNTRVFTIPLDPPEGKRTPMLHASLPVQSTQNLLPSGKKDEPPRRKSTSGAKKKKPAFSRAASRQTGRSFNDYSLFLAFEPETFFGAITNV